MKKRSLPIQNASSTSGYVNESQQLKNIKNNVLLILAILGVCFTIRYNDKTSNVNDTSKQYIDVPSHNVAGVVQLLHVA